MLSIAFVPLAMVLVLMVTSPEESRGKKGVRKDKIYVKNIKNNKIIDKKDTKNNKKISKYSEERKKDRSVHSVESQQGNDHKNYKAINSYITKTYKNIREDDAKLIARYLVNFGKEHQLDPKFAAAVMARESGFDKNAVSSTGAKGLGQIKDFNYKSLEISNPFNIKQNARGTVKYLKEMLNGWEGKVAQYTESEEKEKQPTQDKTVKGKNKTELALASYFKGINAVKRQKGRLDAKTNNYVQDILSYYEEIKKHSNQKYRQRKTVSKKDKRVSQIKTGKKNLPQ